MHTFSREAAATYAQQQVQQKRIERLKAVRAQAALRSKKKSSIYKDIVTATDGEMKEIMADEFEETKSKQMNKLRSQYNALQKATGTAHHSAHQNTLQMQQTAIENQKQWDQQQAVQAERGRTATSILQKRLIEEQQAKETRALWRQQAMEMAQQCRQKLQQQLEQQYFLFRAITYPNALSLCCIMISPFHSITI